MNTVIYSIGVLGCLWFFVCGLAVVHEIVSIVRIYRHELQVLGKLTGRFQQLKWRRIVFVKHLAILSLYAIIYFLAAFSVLYRVLA